MTLRTRKLLGIALRIAVTGFVVLLARGIHWAEIGASLHHAELGWLVPVALLNFGVMALKAFRLRLLLRPAQAGPGECFTAILTSSALNNVTPLRGGDVARLFILERATGISKLGALALAVVEKLYELSALAALVGLGFLAWGGQAWAGVTSALVAGGGLVTLLVLAHAARRPATGTQALGRLLGRLAPGTRAFTVRGVTRPIVLLSLAAWLGEAVMIHMTGRALGLQVDLGLALTVLLGVNLAIALPAAPASVGPFEAAMVFVLGVAGIAKGPALAFALLYHALLVIPVTLLGLAAVLRSGLVAPAGAPPSP